MTPGSPGKQAEEQTAPQTSHMRIVLCDRAEAPRDGRREEGSCPQGPAAAVGPGGCACLARDAPRRGAPSGGAHSAEMPLCPPWFSHGC